MKTSNVVASDSGQGNGLGLGKLKGDLGLGNKGGGGGGGHETRIVEGLDTMLGNKASVTTRVVAS